MAPPTKNKKVVSKDSLRRLMKEKSAVGKSTVSRVDHPCAKYNALEQLTCIVCKSVVKNDRLWNAHIMGRTHKEMVAALKHKTLNQNVPVPSVPQTSKRKSPDTELEVVAKKHKSQNANTTNSIPNDFFDSKTKNKPMKSKPKKSQKPKSILKNATTKLPNHSESSGESDSGEETPSTSGNQPASGVPSDFFDSGAAGPETKPLDPSMAEKLPEGFFDDPKKDAKVREIEYKDKMDEEWEMFQRAMKEQNTVSEQIQEEDDEQKTLERQAEEVDDQMYRWSQIQALAQKKETVMAEKDQNMDGGGADDASSDAETDLDDLMDWRSKSAYNS